MPGKAPAQCIPGRPGWEWYDTTSDKEQAKLINNRQNGRRRGRGGQQARNGQPGGQDRGNRIDNRARGNAAQLLEKYKNLARDAQMQGDRVNTEYYLQFADHYFRVLSESRARFEEQRPRRDDMREDGGPENGSRDDFGGDGDYVDGFSDGGQRFESRGNAQDSWNDGDEDGTDVSPRQQPERQQQPERRAEQPRTEQPRQEDRSEGREQPERRPRRQRTNGNSNGAYANGNNGHAPEAAAPPPAEPEPDGRIALDSLPRGFSVPPANDAVVEDVPVDAVAPRRRAPRRPREKAPVVEG